ncbi:MAG: TolC family protein [Sphingomonadales bacterium]|nr:TolC family protein [Sphingomonadales bacterium]
MRSLLVSALILSCVAVAPTAAAQDLAATIADALANAPALAEAKAGEAAAGARMDRARAEANPLLRLEGTAGFGRIDNGGFFGLTAGNVNPLAVQATAEWPLFTGGRIGSAVDQARGGQKIARLQGEQARLQVTMLAVSTYAEVLTARQLEQSYTGLVDELREVERQAGLRFKVGEIASSEVAQARARRGEAEAGLAQAEGRRASAEAAFERLTGKAPGGLTSLPADPLAPGSLADALDLAHANNPALKQADQAVAVAGAGVHAVRAETLPTVGAFAEAAHVRDQFFPGYKADSVAVGVRGRWTIFSGGRNSSQIRTANAELDGAEARAREARLALDGLVVDAWQARQTSQRMVAASQLRLDAATEALRGTKLEAQVGAKPTLAVLDAEREAIGSKAALLEAEGQSLVAAWRLNVLTGFAP